MALPEGNEDHRRLDVSIAHGLHDGNGEMAMGIGTILI
jgi:hypothetical protein